MPSNQHEALLHQAVLIGLEGRDSDWLGAGEGDASLYISWWVLVDPQLFRSSPKLRPSLQLLDTPVTTSQPTSESYTSTTVIMRMSAISLLLLGLLVSASARYLEQVSLCYFD